ncbi:stalk domain-containing protein [Paenibacillus sp. OAS669]|uniref:stalk domain-containing protein n=1 Tax=Paenibacillus sp. OAS669 TaxID=2663821 RepID=UPI001789431D|nr:stalk domain-containing protein [Paenibacillus sp. OAS669]MBE1444092.1 hypothetical protein [Paenibacillus sp. OAS669]
MKNLLSGIFIGIALSLSSVVFAADAIQALLSPVKFEFNGEPRAMDSEYDTLNYKGHLYVPVRYVADNLGATVVYDEKEDKVLFRSGELNIPDSLTKGIAAGNLIFTKEGNRTKITGQLVYGRTGQYFHDSHRQKWNQLEATLYFFGKQGEIIGEADIKGDKFSSTPYSFETHTDQDISQYAYVQLYTYSINGSTIHEVPNLYEGSIPVPTILHTDLNNVSKVIIHYGPDGTRTIEYQETLHKIVCLLKNMVVMKARSQDLPAGYSYFMDIYDGDNMVRFSSALVLNHAKYVSPSPQKAELDLYIDSLHPNKDKDKQLQSEEVGP